MEQPELTVGRQSCLLRQGIRQPCWERAAEAQGTHWITVTAAPGPCGHGESWLCGKPSALLSPSAGTLACKHHSLENFPAIVSYVTREHVTSACVSHEAQGRDRADVLCHNTECLQGP